MAALASLAYNIGLGRLIGSKAWRYFKQNDLDKTYNYMLRYTKAGGVVLPGLVIRRFIEGEVFMGTLHLLREKQIQKWAEERGVKTSDLVARIQSLQTSDERMEQLKKEIQERKKKSKEDKSK